MPMFTFTPPSKLFESLMNYASADVYAHICDDARGQVPWTEIQVFTDHRGKAYGQYRLSAFFKRLVGVPVAEYLEHFQIDFANPEHKKFCISKIYDAYPHLTSDLVRPVALREYFDHISQPEAEAYWEQAPSVSGFLKAEARLVAALLGSCDGESLYFQPAPIGGNRKLQRVIYLLYDEAQLSNKERRRIGKQTMVPVV